MKAAADFSEPLPALSHGRRRPASLQVLDLFIVPVAERLAARSDVRPVVQAWVVLRSSLSAHLGLPMNASILQWLIRFFVLPREAPGRQIAWHTRIRRAGRPIGTTLRIGARAVAKGVGLLWWPIELAIAWFDRIAARIDVERVASRSERLIGPLYAIPGLRWLLLGCAAMAMVMVLTTPFSIAGQMMFMLFCWGCSMVLRRLPGRYPSLGLAAIGLLAMGRYAWWRLTTTLQFESAGEGFVGICLLLAEAYTWIVVLLGLVQTAWPLERKPEPMRGDRVDWPTIDVFIPTYNEPMSVVRPTVLAALGLDWPAEKLRIFVLDDGRRDEFKRFAEEAGVGYMVRPDNHHAKAGNLNHALKKTDGELIAIFDCDHMPTRSFLLRAVGWFQRDPLCAMVQTPHHFFSPDPFERNLNTFRRVPNEGALFYGLIQDGNDFWNATFFCGSCAVIRRAPLMEVGGIAVETVTEDAHTALKLHRLGYKTAYINEAQAAGLATESLSAHIGQRIRWARGMAQIFRVDNPFLGRGLSIWQRICYANAMMHFLFGLPRLVFLVAPMAYLFFGWHIIDARSTVLALYVLPYIVQSNIATAHVQGEYRHSFWAEVYETVLAWYVALPTTIALINPKLGKFNVTAKGGLVEHSYFDWDIAKPYMVLIALNMVAFAAGLLRIAFFNVHEADTVLLNLIWTAYNLLMLGAAIGVAAESKQVRRTHRVSARLRAVAYLPNGVVLRADCLDFSLTGLGLRLGRSCGLQVGDTFEVGLWRDDHEHVFRVRVMVVSGNGLGVAFEALSVEDEIELVQCTFARPTTWLDWNLLHEKDRPLQGLHEIATLGMQGYRKLWSFLRDANARGRLLVPAVRERS